MSFDTEMGFVFAAEGGEVNDPNDPGGHTKYGVTQAVYDSWRANNGAAQQSVGVIDRAEATRIYRALYWSPSGATACDRLARPKLAACTFDWGVNGGVERARRYLQHSVGADVDGEIGPRSEAAIASCIEVQACNTYLLMRAKHYWARCGLSTLFIRELKEAHLVPPEPSPSQRTYLNGWLARLRHLAVRLELTPHRLFAKGAHLNDAPPTL